METEDLKVSDEEIQEETEAQAEVNEDEVREKVIADLGIEDNDDNKDLIDKVVAREVDHRGRLSKAVGQKIKYRTQLQGDKPPKTSKKPDASGKTDEDPVKAAERRTAEMFMQRDLDEMSHSDELKAEIKEIAERKNISIRQAEKDPYIQFKIGEAERQQKVDAAAGNGKKQGKSGTVIDVSKPLNPADFDLSTEEGRAEWNDAKKARAEARKQS